MSQEWSPEFKMLFWKILGLGLSELALQSSLKKHLREKLKKVDPNYLQFAVCRHLELFLDKSEESRPPLKLKNNGGLLSSLFL